MKIEPSLPTATPPQDKALRAVAEEYEAAFLAEMLKPMGAAKTRESFGGGVGEESFGTFLIEQEARAMVRNGGIGLAESIFAALKAGAESATPNG